VPDQARRDAFAIAVFLLAWARLIEGIARSMSLAEQPQLVGFFSYSREDDAGSAGKLSQLRERIQEELRGQLGRTKKDFRLWQDKSAIAHGKLWEKEITTAVGESAFFIPIVTPTAVRSQHCKFEFDNFLKREAQLGRTDLVFPIIYIRVTALENEGQWREDQVLRIVGSRQYFDWTGLRHADMSSAEVGTKIEAFCSNIVKALNQAWAPPPKEQSRPAPVESPGVPGTSTTSLDASPGRTDARQSFISASVGPDAPTDTAAPSWRQHEVAPEAPKRALTDASERQAPTASPTQPGWEKWQPNRIVGWTLMCVGLISSMLIAWGVLTIPWTTITESVQTFLIFSYSKSSTFALASVGIGYELIRSQAWARPAVLALAILGLLDEAYILTMTIPNVSRFSAATLSNIVFSRTIHLGAYCLALILWRRLR
jgi:hypothetical protein